MTHHSELLNLIAKALDATTYLEIGVFNPTHNFDKIQVEYKIGVDPDTNVKWPETGWLIHLPSDQFFKTARAYGLKFDMGWIDGLHHADQVARDVDNMWACLRPGGVLGIHDANPHSERITHVPRDNREWCGDVYKTVSNIQGVAKFTVDMDYGCCILRKAAIEQQIFITQREIEWEDFDRMRQHYLNLVTVEEAIERIQAWNTETAWDEWNKHMFKI